MKEFIIQWNKANLDLFEYTKEKEIIHILYKTCVLEIVNYITHYKNNCYVWIEQMPIYTLIKEDLNKLDVACGINIEAEQWQRHIWQNRLPQMNFISHWQIHRPTRLEDVEQLTFDYKKWIE